MEWGISQDPLLRFLLGFYPSPMNSPHPSSVSLLLCLGVLLCFSASRSVATSASILRQLKAHCHIPEPKFRLLTNTVTFILVTGFSEPLAGSSQKTRKQSRSVLTRKGRLLWGQRFSSCEQVQERERLLLAESGAVLGGESSGLTETGSERASEVPASVTKFRPDQWWWLT